MLQGSELGKGLIKDGKIAPSERKERVLAITQGEMHMGGRHILPVDEDAWGSMVLKETDI